MKKLETKREINRLAWLFSITYMVSYITRINFGAIIVEMETATGLSKSLLSMALTGSFVTYGIGQVVTGICGDRFSPKKLVSCGLIVTIFMNLLIPLCQNHWQMLVIWSVNGFAQAFMWPPMVKLMTSLLSEEDYKSMTVQVSWGSSFGTIFVYLLSPLLLSAFGWKSVFIFSAALGGVMLFVWNRIACDVETGGSRRQIWSEPKQKRGFFSPLFVCIMIVIVLQGMLRDGVTTWMPSYIAETYHLGNAVSILTGVVLPLFSIVSFQAAKVLYQKYLKSPVLCAGAFFGAGMLASLCLVLTSGQNAGISVFCSAFLTGCMHGVNIMLIGMLPAYYAKQGIVSTVSGLLNSCTYVGSAVSTYGIALLSERFGWGLNLSVWLMITVAGTGLSFLCVKPWKKKYAQVSE